MRNYKGNSLMMGQRLKELRRNAKNSMSQLAFAEEILFNHYYKGR